MDPSNIQDILDEEQTYGQDVKEIFDYDGKQLEKISDEAYGGLEAVANYVAESFEKLEEFGSDTKMSLNDAGANLSTFASNVKDQFESFSDHSYAGLGKLEESLENSFEKLEEFRNEMKAAFVKVGADLETFGDHIKEYFSCIADKVNTAFEGDWTVNDDKGFCVQIWVFVSLFLLAAIIITVCICRFMDSSSDIGEFDNDDNKDAFDATGIDKAEKTGNDTKKTVYDNYAEINEFVHDQQGNFDRNDIALERSETGFREEFSNDGNQAENLFKNIITDKVKMVFDDGLRVFDKTRTELSKFANDVEEVVTKADSKVEKNFTEEFNVVGNRVEKLFKTTIANKVTFIVGDGLKAFDNARAELEMFNNDVEEVLKNSAVKN